MQEGDMVITAYVPDATVWSASCQQRPRNMSDELKQAQE